MNSSRRDQTPAEHRATVEAAARTRLDEGKRALDVLHERELAEAEALSLARIRIQTDQMLAKQAEALRDAERRAELVAIERRSADLDAAKEARRRQELEEQAKIASVDKAAALKAAALAAEEKRAALEQLEIRQSGQRQALAEVKLAARSDKSLRWQVRWLSLRLLSPWKAGLLALALGLALGAGFFGQGSESSLVSFSLPASPLYEDDAPGLDLPLRLERGLRSLSASPF